MKSILRICAVTLAFAFPLSGSVRALDTPPPIITSAPVAGAPVASQNTITTTAPVSSTTTISTGTLAGEVLTWLAAAFSLPIGTLLTFWLKRLFTLAGVQVTQQMSDQLDRTITNGLNAAAANVAATAEGKGQIQIKNEIVGQAVAYAQDHRAETIKALGLDPQSGAAVQAIKARIETLVNDPAVPTPAVLDPVANQAGIAAVADALHA